MKNCSAMAALAALIFSTTALAQERIAAPENGPRNHPRNDPSNGPGNSIDGAMQHGVNLQSITDYARLIEIADDAGPRLNAVIVYDAPAAIAAAASQKNSRLNGRAILVKDNIETAEWPTTAGSLALKENATGRDAPLIANIREAGGVILGKTNLSEWANIRSNSSTSGWSAVGGLTRNPHAIDRNSCGSSSGSGAAVAAGFAWAAIGTETDGSITCPASVNGVVGFKPTVGMVSRTHIVPISISQDTAGPMARSVYDAALLLEAMAGADPDDAATSEAEFHKAAFSNGLDSASLSGIRIGVMRGQIGSRADVARLFEGALADMERAGAVLVDINFEPKGEMYRDEYEVLLFELREGMDAYLMSLPTDGLPRSLADLVAFNNANADREMRWFEQEIFDLALTKTDREAFAAARANSFNLAGPQGIDTLLASHDVEFLVAPTAGPAWVSDLVAGDNFSGGIGMGSLAAIAGYPHLTVPMGAAERLPIGISFIGGKWTDHAVLKVGAAYERVRTAELPTPSFKIWDENGELTAPPAD